MDNFTLFDKSKADLDIRATCFFAQRDQIFASCQFQVSAQRYVLECDFSYKLY